MKTVCWCGATRTAAGVHRDSAALWQSVSGTSACSSLKANDSMPLVLMMHNVSRTFETGTETLTILKDVNLKVLSGTAIAIRGSFRMWQNHFAASGRTSIARPPESLKSSAKNPWLLSGNKLAAFRNQYIGFVFQEHQLLPQCTVLENVLLRHSRDSAQKETRNSEQPRCWNVLVCSTA